MTAVDFCPSWMGLTVEEFMVRANPVWFYNFGSHIHPLTALQPNPSIHTLTRTIYLPELWLDAFLSRVYAVYPFNVSLASARELRKALEAVIPLDGDLPADRELTQAEANRIASRAKEFETVFAAEIGTFNTYSVTRKLAYDTKILIEEADQLLPNTIRTAVPNQCIEDLRQAGKCVAFEIPTAAGFHIIRATEVVIRKYYEVVVGKLPKVKDRNWGSYIKVLRTNGADPRVTGFLDHIREHYRNPVTHPEERLTSEDAQVLLGVCVSAVIQLENAILSIEALKPPAEKTAQSLA